MPVWQALNFIVDSAIADDLADHLLEAGALSVTISDADAGSPFELAQFGEPGSDLQPMWPHADVQVLFAEEVNANQILAQTCAELTITVPKYVIEALSDSNWLEKSRSQFQPIEISPHLWIVPTWHQAVNPTATNIILDPGMAFGTGSHPTTQMCLLWVEGNVRPACSLLDYGCGSGILAIAGKKFAAAHVDALDIDPQAIIAATDNAELNHCSINFFTADNAQLLLDKYDLVVANILANPLRILAPSLCSRVKVGGQLAIAGLLSTQVEELIECYRPWIKLQIYRELDGWVCLSGRKETEALAENQLAENQHAKQGGAADTLLVVTSNFATR